MEKTLSNNFYFDSYDKQNILSLRNKKVQRRMQGEGDKGTTFGYHAMIVTNELITKLD
jgi:hypothetical protein